MNIRNSIGAEEHRAEPAVVSPTGRGYRVEVVERLDTGWDCIVARFADACLEQTAAYMLSRWNSARLCGLVLRDPLSGEVDAAALVFLATLPFAKAGLAYVKFGPLWRRRGSPARPEVLAAALAALRMEFAVKRGLQVRIVPPADPEFEQDWREAISRAGLTLHRTLPDAERYLVDLTLTEEEQRVSLAAKWRANLAKSASGQLDLREVDFQEGLPAFMDLYRTMLARKQFKDLHRIGTLPKFAALLSPDLKVRLFLAFHDGRPIAGSITFGAGERVLVPFSASDERALELRAGYALRWFMINRLRGPGARWLDLGGAEGDDGLRHFKSGNVGKRGRLVQLPGEFDFAGGALSAAMSAGLTFARALARTSLVRRLAPGR
jgi:hypothetical protein